MTAPDPRVGEIQARLDAVTQGPWDAVVSANRKWALVLAHPGTADETELARMADDEDAWFTANAPADVAYLLAELRKATRAAQTLGQVIEKQCRDVLDVTGLHHLINEDGDGHWDVVWMRLFEMRDELAGLKESTIGRERLRGDSWRDRAQEMEVSRDAAAAELRDRDEVIARASDLIGDLTDRDECHFDHHGGCQAHGYLSLDPGETCPQRDAKEWVRAAVAAANGGGERG